MSSPFEFIHPPFDTLSHQERAEFSQKIDIEYYAAGSAIIAANSPMHALYIVMKGLVVGGDEQDIYFGENELFDGKALLEGLCTHPFVALEDTLLWRIGRETILQLCQRNRQFAAYFYQDVARRIAALSPSPQQLSQASLMLSRISDANLSPVHYLDNDASVLTAAQLLQQHGISSVLIRDDARLGIFTQSDLRRVVCLGLIPASEKAAAHASYQLHSVSPDATLHQAMVLMIRHGIHRVLVEQDEQISGVLEQLDLLAALANNPHSIGVQIERASQFDELKAASDRLLPLIQLLQHSGLKVRLIAELIGELRQKLLAKVFQLIAPPEMLAHVCLLALGSEGRGEQILRTDQDNALIIADGYEHPDLATVCEQFNAALLDLGYPSCPGGVMIKNPQWRKTLAQFKQQINDWVLAPNSETMLQLAIWVDASVITGNTTLMYELKTHLNKWLESNTSFMAHFALPIESFPTPLGFFSRLLGHEQTLDLKKSGIFTITHGLRSLALEAGIDIQNSYERLAALNHSPVIDGVLAQDLAASLSFLQNLQLKYGLQAHFSGKPYTNLIELKQLSTLERDLLKDALGVVKQFRAVLRHHFKLDHV